MPKNQGDYSVPPRSVGARGRPRLSQAGPVGRFFGAAGRFALEVAKVVLVALVIIVPIRVFVFQPFEVDGDSMDPNFLDNDYLVVDEISFRFREPERGEVVIFHYPKDRSQFFIKRLIGLPGETVTIKDGKITVHDGEHIVLNESSYLMQTPLSILAANIEVVLGPDEYYVLGDNRDASSDSRSWGPIKRSDIVGRAWFRAFPFDRAQTIKKPTY
ncbi:MAG: signal peptidase I [Candidatus Andersenbacteria bacterium]